MQRSGLGSLESNAHGLTMLNQGASCRHIHVKHFFSDDESIAEAMCAAGLKLARHNQPSGPEFDCRCPGSGLSGPRRPEAHMLVGNIGQPAT